jgi:hypothetical protein
MPVTKQGLGDNQLMPVVVPTTGHAEHAMPTTTTLQDNHQTTRPVQVPGEKEVTMGQIEEQQDS